MQEIWKDIVDYEGRYQISNLGNVKSLPKINGLYIRKEKILTPKKKKTGYLFVALSKDKDIKYFHIHRLVAQHFLPLSEKIFVNHKDGNKSNNHVSNLEWVTGLENIKHAWENDLMKSHLAEKHFNAILNNEQVRKIKLLLSNGELTQLEISKIFNITEKHLNKIATGRIWKSIKI